MTLLYKNLPLSRLRIDVNKNWQQDASIASGWLLSNYKFKKNITVTNAQTDYTNMVVILTMHQKIGIDSGDDVYLNYHIQNDFYDLRFYAGSTLLEHDLGTPTLEGNSYYCEVSIRIPSLPLGDTSITVYYGNSSEHSPGSGIISPTNSAQTIFKVTETDITPGTIAAWTPVDVSTYVPAGATGVLLHIVNTDGSDRTVGFRKTGSTDTYTGSLSTNCHADISIGLNASLTFDAYIQVTNVKIYIRGYTIAGVTFFNEGVDKSPSADDNWETVNCATEAPNAIGLIFQIVRTATTDQPIGARCYGSTDNRYNNASRYDSLGVIIGCDSSQRVQLYKGDSTVKFMLIGYILRGAVFNVDAIDISLAATGSYQDITINADAKIAFIECINTSSSYYGNLRENGSALDLYKRPMYHPWFFPGCDSSGIIEGKISSTNVDFFLIGYAGASAIVTFSSGSESVAYIYRGISNVKEIISGMSKGDILIKTDTGFQVSSPSYIGTNLISNGSGDIPYWDFPP